MINTIKVKIIVAVLMLIAALPQGALAQKDLYKGKSKISYKGETYHVYPIGVDGVFAYIVENDKNKQIDRGKYTYRIHGKQLTRSGVMGYVAGSCTCKDYEANLFKYCTKVFTPKEIKYFRKEKGGVELCVVIDLEGNITEGEFCIYKKTMSSIPFEKYVKLYELLKRNMKFDISKSSMPFIKPVGCLIKDICISF
jgi:hypothetical protein